MPNKPLVFIPGYIATKLKFRPEDWTLFPPNPLDLADSQKKKRLVALLSNPKFNDPNDDVYPVEPIRNILGIAKQADALYSILDNLGYDTTATSNEFRPVAWDWRKGVDDVVTQKAVVDAINDLFNKTGKKVVLLPHSTGGLVMRKLLESQPALTQKIDQVISFGIPWCGTLAAMLALTKPSPIGIGPVKLLSANDIKQITTHAQATYDLLPLNPARTDMTLGDGSAVNLFMENNVQASPLIRTAWMSDPSYMAALGQLAEQRLGAQLSTITLNGFAMPPITNVVGFGTKTLGRCDLLPNGNVQFTDSPTQRGDGTVPLVSGAWLRGQNVRTMFLPIGAYPTGGIPMHHSRIWDSPPVAQLLHEVLQDAQRRPFVAVAADGDDFQMPSKPTVRLRITASDENGKPLPNCKVKFKFGAGFNPSHPMPNVFDAFDLTRNNLNPNVNGTTFFRLPIEVSWTGGKTEVVALFQVN